MTADGVLTKVYVGKLTMLGNTLVSVDDTATGTSVPLEHHRKWGSSGEFAWGYAGAGPSDLAYSILRDHLDCEPPESLVMALKHEVLAQVDRYQDWRLPSGVVAQWLARHLSSSERTQP